MATVLITGASGLIGTALSKALLSSGHTVHHLGRSPSEAGVARTYIWDPPNGRIDRAALSGVTHIVHLAGAGIADKRWSQARVRALIDSRTVTAQLLLRAAHEHGSRIDAFVSAAGIGYYGAVTSQHVFTESDPAAQDTIGRISAQWEEVVNEWSTFTRLVKLRTPVVLAREGGALPKLAAPVRYGVGSPLGSGRQWMPWIHIEDLVALYMKALFDPSMSGAYNASADEHVTNADFMRTLARVLQKPYFMPNVPAFVLKLALGEMAEILLQGSRVSNERLKIAGYRFMHHRIEAALNELLSPGA